MYDSNDNLVEIRTALKIMFNNRPMILNTRTVNTFDNYNNLTHTYAYGGLLNRTSDKTVVVSYKYNGHGDWTEQIKYRKNTPEYIIERTFTYY